MIVKLNNSKDRIVPNVTGVVEKKGPNTLEDTKSAIMNGDTFDYITIHIEGASINLDELVSAFSDIPITRLVIYEDDGTTLIDEVNVYSSYVVNGTRHIQSTGPYAQLFLTDINPRAFHKYGMLSIQEEEALLK